MATYNPSDTTYTNNLIHVGASRSPWVPFAKDTATRTVIMRTDAPHIYSIVDADTHEPVGHVARVGGSRPWLAYIAPLHGVYKDVRAREANGWRANSLEDAYGAFCHAMMGKGKAAWLNRG